MRWAWAWWAWWVGVALAGCLVEREGADGTGGAGAHGGERTYDLADPSRGPDRLPLLPLLPKRDGGSDVEQPHVELFPH